MRTTLVAGLSHRFAYTVPANKTVPHLYPDAPHFAAMPHVFATGYMVGLMEWTCMQLMEQHLESGEGSLGTHVDVSHIAATLPGQVVTVEATLNEIQGKRLWFHVRAHDGLDLIGEGRHERAVVRWETFNTRLADKAARTAPAQH